MRFLEKIGDYEYSIEWLADCNLGLCYVVECPVQGVVGLCAETPGQLRGKVAAGIAEIERLKSDDHAD